MPEKIKIELSFKSNVSKEIMFDLRNYFREKMPGLEFNMKELPPLPGRMGDEFNLINTILYASTVASVELLIHKSLESVNEEIVEKIKKIRDSFVKERKLEKLDISGSVRYDSTKSTFKIDEKKIHYYNDRPYSIDPERTYVLLAGCGDFLYPQINKIPPIKGNLKEMYHIMTEKQYFGIPADHVTTSLNDTSDKIQDLLYEVSKTPGIETFIFYYAGHGFCTDRDSYFLAAYNTQKKNDFINGGIDKEFLKTKILTQSPAKQKIAIIDACYSGILTQGHTTGIFNNEVKGSYILTSSNAKEVSFYDETEPYTFFTDALVKTIKNGVNDESDILTLDDLYSGTCEQLKNRNLQEPTFKNGLSIDPSKFIISNNAAFSVEKEYKKPYELIRQGKYEDASHLLKKLLKKYPDDKDLPGKVLSFENDWLYSRLVKEGDKNFHEIKNYVKAADYYYKALELREDIVVREKLNNCADLISQRSDKKSKWPVKNILISFFAIFFAIVIAKLVTPKGKVKIDEQKVIPSDSSSRVSETDSHTNRNSFVIPPDSAVLKKDSTQNGGGTKVTTPATIKPEVNKKAEEDKGLVAAKYAMEGDRLFSQGVNYYLAARTQYMKANELKEGAGNGGYQKFIAKAAEIQKLLGSNDETVQTLRQYANDIKNTRTKK